MSVTLRVVLVVVSFLMFLYVMKKIKKAQIKIEDTLFWLLGSALLVVISVFTDIVTWGTKLTGVQSEVNFIFLFMIFVLLIKVFGQTIQISQLEHKINGMTQEYAIQQNLDRDEKNE